MSHKRLLFALLALAGLLVGLLPGLTSAREFAPAEQIPPDNVVVRLYFDSRTQLDAVAAQYDVWEVHFDAPAGVARDSGYAVVRLPAADYLFLLGQGYRLEIDLEKTALLGIDAPLDPRYYYFDDDYPNPNGLYMVDFLQDIEAAYPDLTELLDIGNAWQGEHGGYNRDLWVLRITNEDPAYGDIADKPTFVLHANIHAREVTTPEMAIRYIKHLLEGYRGQGGYGIDPDATWLVDWNVAYIMVSANPDGHRVNEEDTSAYRRKNMDNDDGCGNPASWGVDLNRNHHFKWGCCGGSSGDPCAETYRGPARSSEPETFYFQNWITENNILRDQNGPNGPDDIPPAAPLTATGVLLSLHTYADEVLWPWSFTGSPPPNGAEIVTIGRKLGYLTGYEPTGFLYTVDGDTHDWSYGQLGVASFAYEIGPGSGSCGGFFPAYGCQDGIDGMSRDFWSENWPSFIYLHKIARTPYITVYGPDALDVAVVPPLVTPGSLAEVRATVADQRWEADPLRPVTAAEYFVGGPGTDGAGTPLAPADGAWGDTSEAVTATLDTTGLPVGTHYLLIHGRDDQGRWGPYTAVFVYIVEPGVAPVIEGFVREAGTPNPIADALVTAGIFQDSTDATGYYSMTVLSGTYDMLASADGYAPASASGVIAHDYAVVQQDFDLFTYCDIFTDNVEAGNLGWTADWPWAIVTETAHSPEHSWTESPGHDYYNFMNTSLTSSDFDLGEYQGIALSFWHLIDIVAGDYSYVEYSTDGGATWTQAAAYTGVAPWTQETVYFPPALDNQPQVRFRFRFESDGMGGVADGWHVDDIVLRGGGPGCMPIGALVPRFTSNSPVYRGQEAHFTDTSLSNPPVVDWHWDFGDGATAAISNPTHLYAAAGTYTVTLTVSNSLNSDSVSHPFVVRPCDAVQELDFSYTPSLPLVGEVIAFTGTATGTAPIVYTWEFGDGGTAGGITTTHTYMMSGTYAVTLTAENCAGSTAVVHPLTVTLACTEVEIITVTPEIVGCAVTLTAELTGTAPYTYLWDLGDGVTSTAAMPTHTYAQSGVYTGTLDVWNCAAAGHDSRAFTVEVECAAPTRWYVYLPVVFK